ncbi:tetratricopeptide repeat protein, partial [Helicobacter pylori]|uniref:tetratricopeptide repeat protein n=1 Tax=Helicobacter pylori TaxID=210 RepID=UPI0014956EA2
MAKLNPEELFNRGMLSYDKQDFSKAKEYFEKACDLNDGLGCSNLGSLYYNGEGVEKDLTKVAQFSSKACDLNNGDGCVGLGFLYGRGKGKNSKKAAQFYSKACDLNNGRGCNNLGVLCLKNSLILLKVFKKLFF